MAASLTCCMPVADMKSAGNTISSATMRASCFCVLFGGKFERTKSSSCEAIFPDLLTAIWIRTRSVHGNIQNPCVSVDGLRKTPFAGGA
jgi:hypothetical protein